MCDNSQTILYRLRILPLLLLTAVMTHAAGADQVAPSEWTDDLAPITNQDWNRARATHLLERAGFGGTPEDIDALAAMSIQAAVQHLVYHKNIPDPLPAFDHSGVYDAGIQPFPPSRPAATRLAKENGEAIGVKVKPSGNRTLQPVVDRFFYWLRASMLESHRVAYWWAERMLNSPRPLEEKMTLFWHGHFATSEAKVRDYRKLLQQNELFRNKGTANFRDLLIEVSKDPAMLAFLDAGVNVKGSPNENFAREIMELFTMGVGNYSENDIREAARAFTGWNYDDLKFVVREELHDSGRKTVLGKTGHFDGVNVINIILEKPVSAEFIAAKIYRYFVREDLSPSLQKQLGVLLKENDYEIAPLLQTIFMSRDFYSRASVGTRIKPPVELVISTYRKMGLQEIPGVPDFNTVTEMLGQRLLFPPTVAGWAQGKSWITPGLLLARGNFVYDTVFPNINFIPPDRNPTDLYQIGAVADRLALGADVATATQPVGSYAVAESNRMVDRDEDFNTRLGSYRGWRMAIEKVKPIPRTTARLDLAGMVRKAGCKNAQQAVDYLLNRFISVPIDLKTRTALSDYLEAELGGNDLLLADSYLEEPLRATLHLILSLPHYQLG